MDCNEFSTSLMVKNDCIDLRFWNVSFRFQVRQSLEFFNRSKSTFHNSNGMHGFQFHPQMTNHLQLSICLQYVVPKKFLSLFEMVFISTLTHAKKNFWIRAKGKSLFIYWWELCDRLCKTCQKRDQNSETFLVLVWRCFVEVIFKGPLTFAHVCILSVKTQKNYNMSKWTCISLLIWHKIAI